MRLNLTYKAFIRLKTICWFLYVIFAIYCLLFLTKKDLIIGVLISGLLIRLTIIQFLDSWFIRKRPLLLDWFRLITFLTIVLDYFIVVFRLDLSSKYSVGYNLYVSSSFALPALIVVLIGLIAIRIGELLFGITKKSKKSNSEINQVIIKKLFLFYSLLVLVSAIQIFLVIKGVVGFGTYQEHTTAGYSFLLQIIFVLSPFLLISLSNIIFLYNFRSKLFFWFFAGFFVVQIVYGLLTGMKEEIITPFLIVLIPYILSGRKVPKLVLVITIVFMIVIYPIINSYRFFLSENPSISKPMAIQLAADNSFKNNLIVNLVSGTESYSSRLSMFPILMYGIQEESNWKEFKHLDRYIYLPFAWIVPRYFLQSKPISNQGEKLYIMMYGREGTSITPTTYGWAYMEGGYFPVFILFLLFGITISLIQKLFRYKTFFGSIVLINVLISLLKVESDMYFRIAAIFQMLLISYLFYRFFFKEYKIGE